MLANRLILQLTLTKSFDLYLTTAEETPNNACKWAWFRRKWAWLKLFRAHSCIKTPLLEILDPPLMILCPRRATTEIKMHNNQNKTVRFLAGSAKIS